MAGNLGVALVAAGRHKPGVAMLVENVEVRRRVLGDDHPHTLVAVDALATAYRLHGDVGVAVSLYRSVTAQRTRVLGNVHPDTFTSRMGLIRAVTAGGDRAAGKELLAAAIDDAERQYGRNHSQTRALIACGVQSGSFRKSRH